MKQYLINLFISIDQLLNVLASPVLNLLTSNSSYKFGNPDETISSVLGKNVEAGTCRGCHWICRYFLHRLEKHHCRKSIELDEHEI